MTGASPIVFSSFTRTLFPEMLGMRIIRTVLPLIAGVVARALCDIPQAVNQSFSPTFWFVTQPASVTNKPTAMMLEILIFDSIPFARFGSVTGTPAFEQGSRHIRSVLRCRLTRRLRGRDRRAQRAGRRSFSSRSLGALFCTLLDRTVD